VIECESLLRQKWQILSTGCWHTQHYIISISASLLLLNLRKKHVRRKSSQTCPSFFELEYGRMDGDRDWW
jgi:hypothetical protein